VRKKIKLLIFILFIGIIGYCIYQYQINTNDIQVTKLQSQLDKYKQAEQKEEIRKLELLAMQNPEIIQKELVNVGKLIVNEGNYTYQDTIEISKWYGHKELYIDLNYKYGIAIDLNTITIDKFVDKIVYITIPIGEIKLEYIELVNELSKIDGDKSGLVSQFTPQDINIIIENTNDKVRNTIEDNRSIYTDSLISLKENIKSLVLKLGYDDVVFEESL
jgi:hypothetical protein